MLILSGQLRMFSFAEMGTADFAEKIALRAMLFFVASIMHFSILITSVALALIGKSPLPEGLDIIATHDLSLGWFLWLCATSPIAIVANLAKRELLIPLVFGILLVPPLVGYARHIGARVLAIVPLLVLLLMAGRYCRMVSETAWSINAKVLVTHSGAALGTEATFVVAAGLLAAISLREIRAVPNEKERESEFLRLLVSSIAALALAAAAALAEFLIPGAEGHSKVLWQVLREVSALGLLVMAMSLMLFARRNWVAAYTPGSHSYWSVPVKVLWLVSVAAIGPGLLLRVLRALQAVIDLGDIWPSVEHALAFSAFVGATLAVVLPALVARMLAPAVAVTPPSS